MDTIKKILVATTDYPNLNGKVTLMYIHVRNIYYKKQGINLTVLNFSTKEDYQIDGIRVISLKTYYKNKDNYQLLVCHAANIRNHYIFIKKNSKNFKKIIFFYHGHEVLKINETYSKPYDFAKPSLIRKTIQNVYDDFKLHLWNKFIIKNIDKIFLIFVSNWMLEEFLKSTKVPYKLIKNNYSITYNCISKTFENLTFDTSKAKEYDFLTIRANLDGSKYAVDIVNELANKNPDMKFLLYGRGDFFKYFKKAKNLTWINATLNHSEIAMVIQNCRCSLMPTRTDAQGLMMCEIASTGMPLITSDLPVCHEVFDNFKNVTYIDNLNLNINLKYLLKEIEGNLPYLKNKKYFNKNTSQKEVDLIKLMLR